MSERFMYFSSLGFVLVLSWLLVAKLPRLFSSAQTGRLLSLLLLLAILGLYAFKTIDRNRAWVDSYTLFVTDVQVSGNSAKSQASAGEYIMQKAMAEENPKKKEELYARAMHHLSRTLEIHPRHVLALFNQAAVYWYNERDYRAMFANYYTILKIAPGHPKVYNNIHQIMPLVKDPAFKREALQKIREIDGPRYMTSFMLGELYFVHYKDYAKARKYINEALQKNPRGREAVFYDQKLRELGH
jgi:tetratricopeptide (TPR) repeat protein